MDDDAGHQIGIVLLLALMVLLHAAFYGFAAALSCMSESSLEKLKKEGDFRASILLRFWNSKDGPIHLLQFFVTGSNLLAGAYFFSIYAGAWKIGCLALYWMALLTAGIYIPSKIAHKRAAAWALALSRPMCACMAAGFPFVKILEWITDRVVSFFGINPKESPDDLTEEEIISMVNEGHEQGMLLASEAEMIHNIFEFGEKEAKDIMTHRKNIMALDASMDFAKALEFMKESGASRFPVYIGGIDNIIGVLHIKDVLPIFAHPECYHRSIQDIAGLIRKVDFIPETRNINLLFKEMQAEKSHMAVVVDEYGQTAGIVALEDILEEIVGNILDEHDEYEEMIQKQPDGSFIINGMADLEDVKKALEIPDQEEEESFETLNGFLISEIDRIPDEDEEISVDFHGYRFCVLSVKNKIIQKVLVTRQDQDSAGSLGVTVQTGLRTCCADRTKTHGLEASGPITQ